MSASNAGGNRRRSSRGGSGNRARRPGVDAASATASGSKAVRERGARTSTSSAGSRTVSQRSTSAGRSAAMPEISRNEVLGRLLLALAVALAFITVFASLVTGGVVLMLAIATGALGIIGATLFALGRFRE